MTKSYRTNFLKAAHKWICDSYSVKMQYLILKESADEVTFADITIFVDPLPSTAELCFTIDLPNVSTGQRQFNNQSREQVLRVIQMAGEGKLQIDEKIFSLGVETGLDYYSEMAHENRWFSDLHLQVSGARSSTAASFDLVTLDNQLRQCSPPFDGLSDVAAWLSLANPRSQVGTKNIRIRVGPPVDLITGSCTLIEDQFLLVLHAHPKLDVQGIELAIRAVPGVALAARRQVAAEIEWTSNLSDRQEGVARIAASNADSILAMLILHDETVRRQWFVDPVKARNSRLVATQVFDSDLRRLRKTILENSDARDFEKGIASLAFLLGFSPALQVQSDAPDLIVMTPGGQLALVECTLRMADFATKIGKLVDRRRTLSATLEATKHHVSLHAILICAQPKEQLVFDADELDKHQVILFTKEHLLKAFERTRHPADPDEFFNKVNSRFNR